MWCSTGFGCGGWGWDDDDVDESKRRFGWGCAERLLRLQDGEVPAAAAAVAPVAVPLVKLVVVDATAVVVVSVVEPISKLDLGGLNMLVSHNIQGKDVYCLHLPETAGVVTAVGHYYIPLHNRYTRHRVQGGR